MPLVKAPFVFAVGAVFLRTAFESALPASYPPDNKSIFDDNKSTDFKYLFRQGRLPRKCGFTSFLMTEPKRFPPEPRSGLRHISID
jgi:hypothetical protein